MTMSDRKALVIWWNPATNEIELDDMGHGLNVFEIMGMLSVAVDIAACDLPSPVDQGSSDGPDA